MYLRRLSEVLDNVALEESVLQVVLEPTITIVRIG